MSNRPIEAKVGAAQQSTATNLEDAIAAEQIAKETPEQYKARVARVLDRSFVVDRLHVDLPDDLHGEWVPNEPWEIIRYQTLGFKVDDEHAVKRKLNDSGDGKAVVGDVVFMTQPKWQHDILVAEKARIYADTHLKPRQKEEKDYEANVKSLGDVPVTINSSHEQVPGSQIRESLGAKD